MTNQQPSDRQTAKGKKMFLLLALVFVLPFTVAFTLHALDIRPGGKSHGNLITPPTPLAMPNFTDANGKAFAPERWDKIWSVVMVDAASCSQSCEQNVDKLNRVHRTLYKDIDRIQRVLVLNDDADTARVAALQEKFPRLVVLLVNDDADQQQFVQHFVQSAPEGSVYLVDPHRNLMMHYPETVEPKAVRTDLKKLLKTSWSG